MDAEKLQKRLEKEMAAAGTDGPALLAKFVGQVVDRLSKAADHLAKAAKHLGAAMEHNEKMADHLDDLQGHHDAMEGHLDGMKDCMGKAIASGKLGKAEEGEAKDLSTHISGIESAHTEMGKTHDAVDKLIGDQEAALDSAGGAIDDAKEASDDETDKGLAAAERTEKRYGKKVAAIQKASARENAKLKKQLEKSVADTQRTLQAGFNELVKALTPVSPAPSNIEKVTPIRTAPVEKRAPEGAALAAAAAAAGGSWKSRLPTSTIGMPNPDFIKAVETGSHQ